MRRCGTEAKHAEGFRSVVSVLLRALGDFLYTLKAGAATTAVRDSISSRIVCYPLANGH